MSCYVRDMCEGDLHPGKDGLAHVIQMFDPMSYSTQAGTVYKGGWAACGVALYKHYQYLGEPRLCWTCAQAFDALSDEKRTT